MDFNSLAISGKENKDNNIATQEYEPQQIYEPQQKVIKSDTAKASSDNGGYKASGNDAFSIDNSNENAYGEEDMYSGASYEKKLKDALEQANEKLKPINKEFSYSVHEKTGRIMVTIKDSSSGDTIKEIPSEKSLDMLAKIREMTGIMIDTKR